MKNLLAALLCLLLMTTLWLFYNYKAETLIDECTRSLESDVKYAIQEEKWEAASKEYNIIMKKWSILKDISRYFLDEKRLNEADMIFQKASYYIEVNDIGMALSYCNNVELALKRLWTDEKPTLNNIL